MVLTAFSSHSATKGFQLKHSCILPLLKQHHRYPGFIMYQLTKLCIRPVQSYELTIYQQLFCISIFQHCAGVTSDNVPSYTEIVRDGSGTLAKMYQFMTGDQENLRPSLYQFIWEPEPVLHRMIQMDSAGKHTTQRGWWRLCCLEPNSEIYVWWKVSNSSHLP